jgi:hypothetical protein
MQEMRLLDMGKATHGNGAMPDWEMGTAFDNPTITTWREIFLSTRPQSDL